MLMVQIKKIDATDTLNSGRQKINTAIDALVNSEGNTVNVGFNESFDTLADLQAKYPSGASGMFFVFNNGNSDGGHSYMWVDGAWKDLGIYQGKEIADKSIETRKLDIGIVKTKASYNLCVQENIYWDKFVNYQNGNIINNTAYCYVKGKINPLESILIYGTTEQGCFLTETGGYISGYQNVASFPSTIPSNAYYIVQTFKKTQIADAFIGPNEGQKIAGDVLDVKAIDDASIPAIKNKLTYFVPHDFNSFKSEDRVIGVFINYSTGAETSASGYAASPTLEIDPRLRWEILGTTEQLAFYDSFGRYRGGLTHATKLRETVLSDRIRSIRISMKEDQASSVVLRPVQELNSDWITEDNAQKVGAILGIEGGLVVSVKKDGTGDYTSLRKAIEDSAEGTTIKIYDSFNLEDEYSESEIKNTSFQGYPSYKNQTLEGIGDITISGNLDPDVFSDDDIKRVSTITSLGNGKLKNLIIIGESVRYAFHPETHADYLKCTYCSFIKKNAGTYCQAMAGGTRSGQEHIYENCIFETEWTGEFDVPASYHTNNNFESSSTNSFVDCSFTGKGNSGLRFGGMPSGQTNIVNLIGNRLSSLYLKEEVTSSGSGIDYLIRGRSNRSITAYVRNTNDNIKPKFDFVEDIVVTTY